MWILDLGLLMGTIIITSEFFMRTSTCVKKFSFQKYLVFLLYITKMYFYCIREDGKNKQQK